MHACPFFSILIDESTYHTMEKHVIIYVLYISNGGKGSAKCKFVHLLLVETGDAKTMYDSIDVFMIESGLEVSKLTAIAIDGELVMVGHKTVVVARFQALMPRIMGVHCIVHRQALAAKDGFVSHPHVFAFVDKVANKVYPWLGKFAKRHVQL
ncbi:hypothetical protein L7F22_020189 [Adiantum nelumboides]|nr:hypothetical protein [Adiantum nelumboides]